MMMMMMRYLHHLVLSENPNSQLAIIQNSREREKMSGTRARSSIRRRDNNYCRSRQEAKRDKEKPEEERERKKSRRIFGMTWQCMKGKQN